MDGSGNAVVSPVSIIPSSNSKISHFPGGIDENELSHDQISFSNLKISQKSPSSRKHYMSPTISAASKAALPRKNILAERNGVPDVEQILYAKPFNISPKMSSPRCSINSPINVKSCSPAPSIVNAKTSANCSINGLNDLRSSSAEPADLCLKPYDPVTNFLSPRPQFLRYNPNRRRRKIFLHSENEAAERGVELDAKKGLSFDTQKPAVEEGLEEDTQGSSVSWSDDDSGKEDDEKTDTENSEEDTQDSSVFSSEEDNEESSVISSKKDPVKGEHEKIFNENAEKFPIHDEMVEEEEEEDIEVFVEERGWILKGVSQFLLMMVYLIFSTLYIASMNSPRLMGKSEAVWDLKIQYQRYHFDVGSNFSGDAIEATSLWGKTEIEATYELYEVVVEAQEVQNDDVGSEEESTDQYLGLPSTEAEQVQEVLVLESDFKDYDQVDVFELENSEEVSNELQPPSEAAEMYENEINSGLGSDDEKMGSDDKTEQVQEVQNDDVGSEEESTDQYLGLPSTEAEQVQEVLVLESDFKDYDQVDVFELENSEEVSNELQPPSEAAEMYENEINSGLGSDDEKMGSDDKTEQVQEVSEQAMEDNMDSGKPESESDTINQESDSNEFYFPKANLDAFQVAGIVVPIISTILTCLGVFYHLRQKKVCVEKSSPEVEPLSEPVLAEYIISKPVIMEEEKSEGAEKLGSSSSLVRGETQEEVGADISHSQQSRHAPLVELLGELVIGGEISSSRRSYASMSVSEQSPKGALGEGPEVFSHAKTTSLDFSTADSTTLDRSSTAEKEKSRKGVEGTPVRRSSKALPSPSPVRRSSRLRDRSAMSPP